MQNAETAAPANDQPDATQAADLVDLAAIQGGDPERFSRLIERHQGRVAAMAWRFTRDPAEHEQLVQDVFVEAYTSLSSYRQRAPFAHWLARITTRTGYRLWQRRGRERASLPLEPAQLERLTANPAELAPDNAAELLYALLAQLPPRDRLLLTLRYLEGLDVRETAARTGFSAVAVKVNSLRARNRLKKLYDQFTAEPNRDR